HRSRPSGYARCGGYCVPPRHWKDRAPGAKRLRSAPRATPGRCRKTPGAIPRRDLREDRSLDNLDALVRGAVIAMNQAVSFAQAKQALGMPDEEIAIGIETAVKLFQQALLLGFVEIDHDVAAEDDVVALRQEVRLEVVKVELNDFADSFFHGVVVAGLVEITHAVTEIDRFHLMFAVVAFLARTQGGVADVGGKNFHLPWRRDQRPRYRHFKRQGIAQIVISQRVADQHGERVGFVAARAPGTPDAQSPIPALLLAVQDLLHDVFVEKIELRLVAEEAGLVDGQRFQQQRQFVLALRRSEELVVAVERAELARFEAAHQAILEEMAAALVKVH